MPGLLAQPLVKSSLRLTECDGIFINDDGSVVFTGNLVDEQIIVTAGDVIDGGKAFVAKKNILFVR